MTTRQVLISAYACAPGHGSEAEGGWNWVRWTAEAGHAVTVLTQPQFAGPLRHAVGGAVRVEVAKPAAWASVVRGHPRVYADYLAWQASSAELARRLTTSATFDLVHHVSWGSLIWGTPLHHLDVPLVFGPVGGGQVAPPAFKAYFGDSWAKEALRTLLVTRALPRNPRTRATLRGAAVVAVTNAATERAVRSIGAPQVLQMLDTGLSPGDEAEPPGPTSRPPGRMELLWIGRLLPIKALPLALEAVAAAARTAEVRLTVAGGGPQAHDVEAWTRRLGLQDRVSLLGHVPHEQIRPLLRRCDALLFTSLRESFGAQILEAAAQARPAVSLDLHGVGTHLPHTAGYLVPATDRRTTVAALAAAIVTAALDPTERARRGRAARRWALQQRWPARVEAIHRALGNPTRPTGAAL
ncbi:glycosyltransferase [Euzebya tangerina]|uniref:glycosyltransferase n=1 Tax=Euzebya tangerina TaxID=591198 RepID=UPI000E314D16|nr:glycosyltransferase [Euzebya tangerina]